LALAGGGILCELVFTHAMPSEEVKEPLAPLEIPTKYFFMDHWTGFLANRYNGSSIWIDYKGLVRQ